MKKTLSLLIFIAVFRIDVPEQKSYIKDRLNVKIAYNGYPWMGDMHYDEVFSKFYHTTPASKVDVNYGFFKFLESGAYIGFSMYEWADFSELERAMDNPALLPVSIVPIKKPMILYGVNLNMQLLPFIVACDDFFLDVYLSAKLGGIYFVDKNKSLFAVKHSNFDYGFYGGLTVHPFKHWGLFGEYGFGNYIKWSTRISLRY